MGKSAHMGDWKVLEGRSLGFVIAVPLALELNNPFSFIKG